MEKWSAGTTDLERESAALWIYCCRVMALCVGGLDGWERVGGGRFSIKGSEKGRREKEGGSLEEDESKRRMGNKQTADCGQQTYLQITIECWCDVYITSYWLWCIWLAFLCLFDILHLPYVCYSFVFIFYFSFFSFLFII